LINAAMQRERPVISKWSIAKHRLLRFDVERISQPFGADQLSTERFSARSAAGTDSFPFFT
jgi:hypothetical protein